MKCGIAGLSVAFLAAAAPRVLAQSVDGSTSPEKGSDRPVVWRKRGAVSGPAAASEPLPPEALSPQEEGQLLRDAERTVQSADIVVDAEPEEFPESSSRTEFHVSESLKGSVESDRPLTVDLRKAPVGLWPREGERRILCLAPDGSGGYELAAYHASILPSTDRARDAVKALVQGLPLEQAVPEGKAIGSEEAGSPTEGEPQPLTGPYADYVARSETILVGVLSNIEPAGVDGGRAEGVFRLDEKEGALLGYDGYRAAIVVRLPPPGEDVLDDDAPRAGRYMLFLKGSMSGPGFESIHRIALTEAAAEAELRREVLRQLGPRRDRLTAIQSTLAEWQDAWNARDLERCIGCYSSENASRKVYEAGGPGREELERQVAKFASTVMVTPQRTQVIEDAEGGRTEAETTVLLELTVAGVQDRRTVKMRFVREEGEWLILDEGL